MQGLDIIRNRICNSKGSTQAKVLNVHILQ
jgi:hypothetical protein